LVGALLAGAGAMDELEAEAGLTVPAADVPAAGLAGVVAGADAGVAPLPFFGGGSGFCLGRKVIVTGPAVPLSPTM
jgi:hypothetical protein